MKSAVIASVREGSGKTSILVGAIRALQQRYGYIKPLGDRLIYRKKRNRDYDSNLMMDLFEMDPEAEKITLGFDHSKLRYQYDCEGIQQAVRNMAALYAEGKDGVFIEAGKNIFYGSSLKLDPLSLASCTGSPLVLVVAGSSEGIMDDLTFFYSNFGRDQVSRWSVICNKVHDPDEFESLYSKDVKEMGYKLLGVLPFKSQLTRHTIAYLSERLYAKVVAGEAGMGNTFENIFVGAMSTGESLRNPLFNKKNKFLITSGDRNDMVLEALESDTVGVLLTNNILPPSHIIARADEKNIPLLLVSMDTYTAARRVGKMETLLTKDHKEAIELLTHMAEKYLDLKGLTGE